MNYKKLLSYFWPQTIKIDSDYNGTLEITYYNGKKVLDSENANYSYGSLQKILEFGFDQIEMSNIRSVLMLGLGAGSAIHSIRNKYHYQQSIKVVEFDDKVIQIAKNSFNLQENSRLNIIHSDAFVYMKQNVEKHDLIIVDLFVDQKVPKQFYSKDFCDYLYQSLFNKGTLIFNIGILQNDSISRNQVKNNLEELGCTVTQYDKILKTNSLLIAIK